MCVFFHVQKVSPTQRTMTCNQNSVSCCCGFLQGKVTLLMSSSRIQQKIRKSSMFRTDTVVRVVLFLCVFHLFFFFSFSFFVSFFHSSHFSILSVFLLNRRKVPIVKITIFLLCTFDSLQNSLDQGKLPMRHDFDVDDLDNREVNCGTWRCTVTSMSRTGPGAAPEESPRSSAQFVLWVHVSECITGMSNHCRWTESGAPSNQSTAGTCRCMIRGTEEELQEVAAAPLRSPPPCRRHRRHDPGSACTRPTPACRPKELNRNHLRMKRTTQILPKLIKVTLATTPPSLSRQVSMHSRCNRRGTRHVFSQKKSLPLARRWGWQQNYIQQHPSPPQQATPNQEADAKSKHEKSTQANCQHPLQQFSPRGNPHSLPRAEEATNACCCC